MNRISHRARALCQLAAAAALFATCGMAQAMTTVQSIWSFGADFESGFSGWTDRQPSDPDGQVVADPLRPGNHVLNFKRTVGGGSVFSNTQVSSAGRYVLSFDYLGLPRAGSVPGDLGGFIGVSGGLYGSREMWLAGTRTLSRSTELIDDGKWRSYSIEFTRTIGQSLCVKAEDFSGSGGVAGDAYFDNIVLRDSRVQAPALNTPGQNGEVPEPTSLALVGLALAGLGALRARGRNA